LCAAKRTTKTAFVRTTQRRRPALLHRPRSPQFSTSLPIRGAAAAATMQAPVPAPVPTLSDETRSSFEIKMIQAGHTGADRRVVYECNFQVDSAISREFMQYLRGHMREVRACLLVVRAVCMGCMPTGQVPYACMEWRQPAPHLN